MAFGVGGFFGDLLSNPETGRIVKDLGIAQAGAEYLDRARDTGSRNIASENEYDALLKGAAKKVSGLEAGDMEAFSQMLARANNQNYLGDYGAALNLGFDKLGTLTPVIQNAGSAYDKMRAAMLGRVGGKGTYETNATANRISSNILPLAGQIFASAPGVASNSQNAWLANLAASTDLINRRAAVPYRGTMNPVDVANFRNANWASDVARFGDLSRIQGENVAGFETKDNKWANAFKTLGNTEQGVLNAATSIISAYLGGGGGGGNPAGTPQPAAPTYQPLYQPTQAIAQQPAFYSGQTVSPYPQAMPGQYPTAAPQVNWASQAPAWYAQSQGGFGWNGGY